MSVSGLPRDKRLIARERVVQAALLGLHHAPELHYTQGPQRWEGIDTHKVARRGEYPRHADCSAFVTWCLWNALHLAFGLPDIVNGQGWKAGWTGTLAQHGRHLFHHSRALPGDLVLYGSPPSFEHVAIIVGKPKGYPVVVSNGSESGPYLLPYNYRSDVGEIRRYI